ncbi:MAG: DUF1801 domain-containing protein [Bacteroidota bacterium]
MSVESYIASQDPEVQPLYEALHEFILQQGELETKLSYKIPFYYRHSWVCYLSPRKAGGIEVGFPRGNELSNEQGILVARGRKQVRSVDIPTEADIPWEALREIIQEALFLDETVPYASKRTKKS